MTSKQPETITPGILSHWRDALELSQTGMAKLLGVPIATYLKWEHGDRKPPSIATQTITLLHWLETYHPRVFEQIRNARVNSKQVGQKGGN